MGTFRGSGDPNTEGVRVASQDDLDAAVARAEQAVDDAEAQAGAAAASAQSADTSAIAAAASATEAAGYATDADNTLKDFETKYLGSKISDPTLDNEGNALITGALYYNSVEQNLRAYTGSAWRGSILAASSPVVDENLAVWDGTTGTLIKDGGVLDTSSFVTGPAVSVPGNTAVFADSTGKVLQDSGAPPGGGGDYAAEVLMDNPDSFWEMQDAALATVLVDSSGNTNTGSYNGANAGQATSLIPNDASQVSASFVAINDALIVPNGFSQVAATTAYTMEFWFSSTQTTNRQFLWDVKGGGSPLRILFALNASKNNITFDLGKMVVVHNNTNPDSFVSTVSAYPAIYDGNPHHIAIAYTEPNVALYLDGVSLTMEGTFGDDTGILNNENDAYIGRHATNTSSPFAGNLSHYAMWYNTAVSSARLLQHYLAGST